MFYLLRALFPLLLIVFLFGSCHKDPYHIHSCINDGIKNGMKEDICGGPHRVIEYTYKGKRVYYFEPMCTDQYNFLYDEQCNYLCAPSGGMDGRGDGKCPDFQPKETDGRVIWEYGQ